MNPKVKCAECSYYQLVGHLDEQISYGKCRCQSPVFVPTRNNDAEKGLDNRAEWGGWPLVLGDSWCGEFDTEK